MALNPNIILQGQTPKFDMPDPIAQYSKGLQLKGLMQQQTLQDQAMADDQATRSAYQSGGGDTSAVLKSLMQGGNYKAAAALQKQLNDQAATQSKTGYQNAQTGKTLNDINLSKLAQHRDELANVNSPEDAVVWAKQGLDQGIYPGGEAQYQATLQNIQRVSSDPLLFNQFKQQAALGATKYIEQNAPKYQTNNLGGKTVTMALPGLGGAPTMVASQANSQSPDSAASNATTMRGQNMVDARSRLTANQGNIPSGYRQTSDGNLEAIPGGPAMGNINKPLTDSQAKSAGFGARMQAADQTLNDLAAQGTSVSVPGSHSGYGVGAVVNALSPAKQQNLDQAKRDFINAILRRESGAAISQGEFDNAEKQYFPQLGDKPDVIAQKAKNRAISTRGVLSEVPGNQREDTVSSIIGNGGAASNAGQKTFSSLPDPASLNGKRIQAPDGSIMRSNGNKWIQEK
jgi:hypothetical protein